MVMPAQSEHRICPSKFETQLSLLVSRVTIGTTVFRMFL